MAKAFRPTHELVMVNKLTKNRARVGVAWPAEGTGSEPGFSIMLNPGVVLSHRDGEVFWFGLWPMEGADG